MLAKVKAMIENMLPAITAPGCASAGTEGHITDEDRICDKMARILGVPDGYDPVCFLSVGKPAEEMVSPKKMPFAERARFNAFGNREE